MSSTQLPVLRIALIASIPALLLTAVFGVSIPVYEQNQETARAEIVKTVEQDVAAASAVVSEQLAENPGSSVVGTATAEEGQTLFLFTRDSESVALDIEVSDPNTDISVGYDENGVVHIYGTNTAVGAVDAPGFFQPTNDVDPRYLEFFMVSTPVGSDEILIQNQGTVSVSTNSQIQNG